MTALVNRIRHAFTHEPIFNVSWRTVGVITFVRIGRFNISFCMSRSDKR